MDKTTSPYFTLPKYKAGHDLAAAQEVPPKTFEDRVKQIEPKTGMEYMDDLPVKDSHHGLWLNLAKRHAQDKRMEFQEDYVKCHCFWPDGTDNWITVDAGGYWKVW